MADTQTAASAPKVQLTQAERERIRQERDRITREQQLHRGADGQWRLTVKGYRRT